MHIKFSSRPFDKILVDCAVIPVFTDERPFQGDAALLDWRLNGRLSQLIQGDRYDGGFREVLLMPSEGRVLANALLIVGLGSKNKFNEAQMNSFIQFFLEKIAAQKVKSFLISFSDLIPSNFEWRNSVRLMVSKLIDNKHIETIVLCESEERIREAKRRHMDFGMNIEVSFDNLQAA